jgi:hypothetical protein
MTFEAHTDFGQVSVDTRLVILETSQLAGDLPSIPLAGGELAIHLSPPVTIKKAKMISSNATEIVLEVDGETWKLTPPTDRDVLLGFVETKMASSKWVVREKW